MATIFIKAVAIGAWGCYLVLFITIYFLQKKIRSSMTSNKNEGLEEIIQSIWSPIYSGYEDKENSMGQWPGTEPGCDCRESTSSDLSDTYKGKVLLGKCQIDMVSCKDIAPIKPIKIQKWKQKSFIPLSEPTYQYYLQRISQHETSCKYPFIQCGILDTLNQPLCIEKLTKCPWNKIVASKSAVPQSDYHYETIAFNDNTYLHCTNEATNSPIFTELLISEGPILKNKTKLCRKTSSFLLENPNTIDCKSNPELTDKSYILIDSIDKKQFFSDLSIYKNITDLPEIPKDFFDTTIDLYGKNYIGIKQQCLKIFELLTSSSSDGLKIRTSVSSWEIASLAACILGVLAQICIMVYAIWKKKDDKWWLPLVKVNIINCFLSIICVVGTDSLRKIVTGSDYNKFDCGDEETNKLLAQSFTPNNIITYAVIIFGLSCFAFALIFIEMICIVLYDKYCMKKQEEETVPINDNNSNQPTIQDQLTSVNNYMPVDNENNYPLLNLTKTDLDAPSLS